MRPSVSVVIPFFDAAPWLADAVDSVLAQSVGAWELWLVDDGSQDGGHRVAQAFAARDARVRLVRQGRRGPFSARLAGARRARAPWVALLDADDVWERDYLARRLARAARARAGLVYGPVRYEFPGRPERGCVQSMPCRSPRVFAPGELLQNFLSGGYATVPCTSASLLERRALLEAAPLEAQARRAPAYEDQFLMWAVSARRRVAAGGPALVRCRRFHGPRALEGSGRGEERRFLRALRRWLRRACPAHPVLGQAGIEGRLARRPYFYARVPAALRAGAARVRS